MGKTLMETVVEKRRFRDAVRLVKGPPDASMNTTPEFRHEKASVGGLARYRPLQVAAGAVCFAGCKQGGTVE